MTLDPALPRAFCVSFGQLPSLRFIFFSWVLIVIFQILYSFNILKTYEGQGT